MIARVGVALALFLFALAASARPAGAQPVAVAADDFESGSLTGGSGIWTSAWIVNADVLVVTSGQAHSGNNHMRIRGDGSSARRTVDLTGLSDVKLQFWAKAESFERRDVMSLFIEGAQGREGLKTWVDREDDDEYHLYTFAIPDDQVSAAFVIDFVSGLDSSSDRFFVDDISISSPDGVPVPPIANPIGNIVLDSNFSDWIGMPNLVDPFDDTNKQHADLFRFYWANRVDQQSNYWMIERYTKDGQPFSGNNGHSPKVDYIVHIDTGDNGIFSDPTDKQVLVEYEPTKRSSKVSVSVRSYGTGASGNQSNNDDDDWDRIFKNVDWGQSDTEGGLKVEFQMPWEELGVGMGQPIRMFATSEDDRLPDTGDVQWSPASILGHATLVLAFLGGVAAIWWYRGRRLWRSA